MAEPADNMTLWFNDKFSKKDEKNNNNEKIGYIPPEPIRSPKICPTIISYEFNEIRTKVESGQKIMIILRGAAGSGKSTLAKKIIEASGLMDKYTAKDFIFASDEYFVTRRGYEFNPNLLPEAHEWNKYRVRSQAAVGWSPIIIDNTNTMIWEMQPYAQIAVQYGYVLELLEPQTSWSKSVTKLTQKNVHGVTKEAIQRMLDRFEKTSAAELIMLLKDTKYTVSLPQMRLQPPLPALPAESSSFSVSQQAASDNNGHDDDFKLNINAKSWVPYEKNAPSYWADQGQVQGTTVAASAAVTGENSLLDLLRNELTATTAAIATTEATCDPLQRHSVNCPNEADGFILLRQMYPNKQPTGLWDLYVKCKGDVDWAVDILLKEFEVNTDAADYIKEDEQDELQCACNSVNVSAIRPLSTPLPPLVGKSLTKPQPQRQPRGKRYGDDSSVKELQVQLENCFVLGDDQYSDHTRKIRAIRNGILDKPLLPLVQDPAPQLTNPDEDDEDVEDNALLEIELDNTLITQLRQHFQWELEMLPLNTELDLSPTNVFIPRQLAKQLYMVYMEAVHNQLEEQRQKTLRDDELFARLLKHPRYEEYSESPDNVNELLDMELAWSIYNSEQLVAKQSEKPNDIATHLTKMKLCDKFPDIPKDTVLEIFAATDNNYVKTVEVLDSNVKSELTGAQLYERALREHEKLNAQVQQEQQQPSLSKLISSPRSAANAKSQSPQLHEDAKNAALRDFEETRNLAAHHAQLRAECNLKARHAIQQGNGSVAVYYSEIAQLHKKKIDVFNHRAANCIMEVHKHTQNNPDLLDLHYLHATEAVSSLDLFLDRHITVLRNCTRVYKHVFIITGRGLHSANGVSTIKKRVKIRLADRRLRWQEVNPGLLRVKVFSASRHSKNF